MIILKICLYFEILTASLSNSLLILNFETVLVVNRIQSLPSQLSVLLCGNILHFTEKTDQRA